MTKRQEKETEKTRCMNQLKQWLKPGDTVYTVVRHVSRSGMQRSITALIPVIGPKTPRHPTGQLDMVNISYYVAKILDWRMPKDTSAVIVNGCGMDMGFHLIYSVSSALYREDAKNDKSKLRLAFLKDRVIINDDAGYWLTQRWV